MTLDRRDWVEVGCEECGWGIRGREENVTKALSEHRCEKSQEEKTPEWFCRTCSSVAARGEPLVHSKHCPEHRPQRSVSPSNASEPSPPTQTIQYESGVRRTPKAGKTNWSLTLDGPLLSRLARHLTKGEETHGKRNWMKANSEEDLERFRESAVRHFFQWYYGETNEDHFAATVFNMNGAELCKDRLREELPDPDVTGYR